MSWFSTDLLDRNASVKPSKSSYLAE